MKAQRRGIDGESRWVVAKGSRVGRGGGWGGDNKRARSFFGGDDRDLELTVVTVAHICENTKNH